MEEPSVPSSEKPALSQRAILLLRLLLLLLAASAVVAGVVVAIQHPVSSGLRYVCPMHADVRTSEPSTCPVCGMALEPIGRGGNGNQGGRASIPDMTAFENIRKHKIMGFVRMRSLTPALREIRGPAWATSNDEVSAILYRDQVESLSPDERGTFVPSALPKTSVKVVRSLGPAVPWDSSTSLVRFRVEVRGHKKGGIAINAGQVGWLEIAAMARAVVTVPVLSVLQEPEGPYVLAWTAGKLEKRRIEIGEYFALQGFAVVLSGLRPNDHVVTRATFFVDADRRLGGNDEPMWSVP